MYLYKNAVVCMYLSCVAGPRDLDLSLAAIAAASNSF